MDFRNKKSATSKSATSKSARKTAMTFVKLNEVEGALQIEDGAMWLKSGKYDAPSVSIKVDPDATLSRSTPRRPSPTGCARSLCATLSCPLRRMTRAIQSLSSPARAVPMIPAICHFKRWGGLWPPLFYRRPHEK